MPEEFDKELSFKNFTGKDFSKEKKELFEGKIIKGSCFYWEDVGKNFFKEKDDKGLFVIFPKVNKLTFINCNLDNVHVEPEWVLINCSNRKLKVDVFDGKDYVYKKNGTKFKSVEEFTLSDRDALAVSP